MQHSTWPEMKRNFMNKSGGTKTKTDPAWTNDDTDAYQSCRSGSDNRKSSRSRIRSCSGSFKGSMSPRRQNERSKHRRETAEKGRPKHRRETVYESNDEEDRIPSFTFSDHPSESSDSDDSFDSRISRKYKKKDQRLKKEKKVDDLMTLLKANVLQPSMKKHDCDNKNKSKIGLDTKSLEN